MVSMVHLLAVSLTHCPLVGSAAGSTFARIFFRQIDLGPVNTAETETSGLEHCPSQSTASLPARPVSRLLLSRYIEHVHARWPFMRLSELRRAFLTIYQDPRKAGDVERFVVFAVLALASSECSGDREYEALLDLNTPESYFATALRFFASFHDHPRDLRGIQAVLLLALWMLNSDVPGHCNDLWHLSRYLMSAAIELGVHRHNPDWGFSADELEVRNRTWWCIYVLERHVAIITGRVLSIRDHAVHALAPANSSFDALDKAESLAAPTFHKHGVLPLKLRIRLGQISGRILESVYIGRGPDGTAMATSYQQIFAASDESRKELEAWKQELADTDLKPSRAYSELKIEYFLLQLLLNRPSPTFMVPSNDMIAVCSKAASGALRQWAKLESEHGIAAVCRCFRQLHSLLIVGLAALYCDWQLMAISRNATSDGPGRGARHWVDTAACLDLIRAGVRHMARPGLARYQDLFQAVRTKVYSRVSLGPVAGAGSWPETHETTSRASYGQSTTSSLFFSGDGDVERYMSHVSAFFSDGTVDVDEQLSAWYDAVMDEIEPLAMP